MPPYLEQAVVRLQKNSSPGKGSSVRGVEEVDDEEELAWYSRVL